MTHELRAEPIGQEAGKKMRKVIKGPWVPGEGAESPKKDFLLTELPEKLLLGASHFGGQGEKDTGPHSDNLEENIF